MDRIQLTATTTGVAGSATGTATTANPIFGRVWAVHVDYITQPATADVILKATGPDQTILTLTNANTDGWFYPRRVVDTTAGAAAAGVYDTFAVHGNINVAVAQGDAGSVVVTILVEH